MVGLLIGSTITAVVSALLSRPLQTSLGQYGLWILTPVLALIVLSPESKSFSSAPGWLPNPKRQVPALIPRYQGWGMQSLIRPMIHTSAGPSGSCIVAVTNHYASQISLWASIATVASGGSLFWLGLIAVSAYSYAQAQYQMSQSCNGAHAFRTANWNYCSWTRVNLVGGQYKKVLVDCYGPLPIAMSAL